MKSRCPGNIFGIQGEMNYKGFLLSGFSATCAGSTDGSSKPKFPVHAEKSDWFYSLVLKAHSKNKSLSLS